MIHASVHTLNIAIGHARMMSLDAGTDRSDYAGGTEAGEGGGSGAIGEADEDGKLRRGGSQFAPDLEWAK